MQVRHPIEKAHPVASFLAGGMQSSLACVESLFIEKERVHKFVTKKCLPTHLALANLFNVLVLHEDYLAPRYGHCACVHDLICDKSDLLTEKNSVEVLRVSGKASPHCLG